MQDNLVAHLRETYKPDAILLHGSRARGKARPHSDWDFVFLYNRQVTSTIGRELYQDQNVEFSMHTLPVENIEATFGSKLRHAQVMYEQGKEGTDLLAQAAVVYDKAIQWSPEKIQSHKLWVQGQIDGMRDSLENPVLFSKYLSDLYPETFNYWYWLVKKVYSEPVYIAAEEIATKEPEYYQWIIKLADPKTSPEGKVSAAENIRTRLFGN